jgi:hypothetical protein
MGKPRQDDEETVDILVNLLSLARPGENFFDVNRRLFNKFVYRNEEYAKQHPSKAEDEWIMRDDKYNDDAAHSFLKKARDRIRLGQCQSAFDSLANAGAMMHQTPATGPYLKTRASMRRVEKLFLKKCVRGMGLDGAPAKRRRR